MSVRIDERGPPGGGCNPVAANVVFSSVAALIGSPGQGGYSGANSAVDSAAMILRRGGHPVSSLQWGAWGGGGMAAKDPTVLARIQRQGIGVLSPERGLAVLGAVLRSFAGIGVSFGGGSSSSLHDVEVGDLGQVMCSLVPARNLAASPFDWARVARYVRPLPQVCKDVCEEAVAAAAERVSAAAAAAASTAATATALGGGAKIMGVECTTAAAGGGRENAVEGDVVPCLGDIREVITRVTVDLTGNKEISPHEPLMSAGLDSLAGMGRACPSHLHFRK